MTLATSTLTFDERVEKATQDKFARKSIAKAQDTQWDKREKAREKLGNWQDWRNLGEQIRQNAIAYLPDYLEQFSDNVDKRGGHVFFAKDEKEAADYIQKVVKKVDGHHVVKSKSMVTTEINLDQKLLELDNLTLLESDLAEFILQKDDWDEPSHIVFPTIHKNRDQIREIFMKLGYEGDNDPETLARFARKVLREEFLKADVGITGCNFAIADSGMINLDTNEGNADLVISIPKTQIVVMGMERIVPSMKEAETLDNMLARSAVGQNLTTYCTFAGQKRPDESDGPEDFYVVVLDNGRSKALGTEFQPILQCIRCGACLNVCPVYRNIGGHGYGSIYPGPVGAVLSPILGGYEAFGDLPYASSLCGACTDVCPVKIPLHQLLIAHRKVMTDDLKMPHGFTNFQMKVVGQGTAKPWMFKSALQFAHTGMGPMSKKKNEVVENFYNYDGHIENGPGMVKGWTDVRDLPRPPKHSEDFRSWYKKHKAEQEAQK